MDDSKHTDRDEMKRLNELNQKKFKKNKNRITLKNYDTYLLKIKWLLIGKKTLIANFV